MLIGFFRFGNCKTIEWYRQWQPIFAYFSCVGTHHTV